MINLKILTYLAGFLAIFALISAAYCESSDSVKGNLVDATTVASKVIAEQVTLAATDGQSSQIDHGEEGTSPKPPMVQYIVRIIVILTRFISILNIYLIFQEEVFTGIQNILGNVAEIVKSSFGSIGRQSDNTVHPRN